MNIQEIEYQITILREEKASMAEKYHGDYDKGIRLLERAKDKQEKLQEKLQESEKQAGLDYQAWLVS